MTTNIDYSQPIGDLIKPVMALRYGGQVMRSLSSESTMSDLYEWLFDYSDKLAKEVDRNNALEEELSDLKHDIAAMRRVFGS